MGELNYAHLLPHGPHIVLVPALCLCVVLSAPALPYLALCPVVVVPLLSCLTSVLLFPMCLLCCVLLHVLSVVLLFPPCPLCSARFPVSGIIMLPHVATCCGGRPACIASFPSKLHLQLYKYCKTGSVRSAERKLSTSLCAPDSGNEAIIAD